MKRYATFEEVARAIKQGDVGGNVMAAEEATEFVLTTLNEQKLMPSIQNNIMTRETKKISTLGMTGRATRGPGAGTVNEEEAAVTYGENTLTGKKTMLNFRIEYEATMFNIEGSSITDTLKGLAATTIGNSNEDLGINGAVATDPAADDYAFLKQNDGWLALAEEEDRGTHKVNSNDLTKMSEKFEQAMMALPAKWRSAPTKAFICSDTDARSWALEVSGMVGAYNYLLNGVIPPYAGIPIVDLPAWPTGTIFHGPTRNLNFGVVRDSIRNETDVDIESQEFIFVWSMFIDYEFGLNDAVVVSKDRGPA